MSNDISIRVPKVMATPAEFAEWEGRLAVRYIK